MAIPGVNADLLDRICAVRSCEPWLVTSVQAYIDRWPDSVYIDAVEYLFREGAVTVAAAGNGCPVSFQIPRDPRIDTRAIGLRVGAMLNHADSLPRSVDLTLAV